MLIVQSHGVPGEGTQKAREGSMGAGNVSETTTFGSFMQQGLTRTQLSECKDKIVMIIRSAVSNVTLIKCRIVAGAALLV